MCGGPLYVRIEPYTPTCMDGGGAEVITDMSCAEAIEIEASGGAVPKSEFKTLVVRTSNGGLGLFLVIVPVLGRGTVQSVPERSCRALPITCFQRRHPSTSQNTRVTEFSGTRY